MKKYGTTGQATDDYMAHAHCMLDTLGYKHTPRIYNIYFILKNALLERASILPYTYVYFACLVLTHVTIYIPL